jgi:hypothetical protein
MGTIAGSSYIWRPWFAVTSGQLNLTLNETDNSGQPTTESEFITGDAQLSLFPTSRFPFSIYYIESRNQFDDPVFDSDVETREYGFRQLYRSFDGRHNYRAEYENNQREESELDDFLAERLIFSADNRLANQIFNTDLSVDTIENRGSDEFSDSYLLKTCFPHRQSKGICSTPVVKSKPRSYRVIFPGTRKIPRICD